MAQLSTTALATDPNLEGYYKLESDGTDSSSKGRTLTINGSPSFVAAKYGNGMSQGTANTTKYATIANNMGVTGGSMSMVGWINFNDLPVATNWWLFAQASVTNNDKFHIFYDGTNMNFWRTRLGVADDTSSVAFSPSAGTWHHIGYTYDGTTVLGYIDGVQKTTLTSTGNGSSGGTDRYSIGNNLIATPATDCIFDDCAIFSRKLTAAEISTLATDTPSLHLLTSTGVGR